MLYDVKTPKEYLEVIEDDWRKVRLLEIRELLLNAHESMSEGINYKMLEYSLGDKAIFNLNAQKAYVGLYVGDIKKIDEDGSLLRGLDCGKGCIRIKKTNTLDSTNIDAFIKKAVEYKLAGIDFDC